MAWGGAASVAGAGVAGVGVLGIIATVVARVRAAAIAT